jgi:hypothetical protein
MDIESLAGEQPIIDAFIRYNIKMLKRMDEHNCEYIDDYVSEYDLLGASEPYTRKSAVRRILAKFLSDWG